MSVMRKAVSGEIGDWGLGTGDWRLGIGDWRAEVPLPSPRSPIPNIAFVSSRWPPRGKMP
ncbi:MAG: hypothetical protein DWI57_18320 [Chloroflexi bacterium]|nr:MAG: hypothetical protein DWI57_18320 [Chloroflexota bacterium]